MDGRPDTNSAHTARSSEVLAIQPELRLCRIAVSFHVQNAIGPVGIAPPNQMQCGCGVPICAIKIESVFVGLAVGTDQSLIVDVREIAFETGIAGKIEHVPDIVAPDIGPRFQSAP